jgi:hypothetical protein
MLAKLCRYIIIPLCACVACLTIISPAAHADGGAPNRAYVAGTSKGISVIDISQQQIVSNLPGSGDPHAILLSLDGGFLYVTQPQKNSFAILSARTGSTVCTAQVPGQPSLLALDSNSNTIYVAGPGASTISAIDTVNCNVKRTLQADGPVHGLAVALTGTANTSNNSDQVWASTPGGLDVFNETNGQKMSSIPVPGGPQYLSIPPGTTIYVTTQQGTIVAVSLTQHQVTSPLVSGGKYGPMDFDEQTGEIFVPDQAHNQLVVLLPVNVGFTPPHEPSRTIKLASAPNSIAITSDGQLGFTAMQNGSVTMLDIPGRQQITTFHVGGDPQFIITGLNPPVLASTPQQAILLGTLANIAAYILVIALLVVPVVFFVRFSRKKQKSESASEPEPTSEQAEDAPVKEKS